MVKKIAFIVCLSAWVSHSGCSQTQRDKERLRIAREFVLEVKYGMASAEVMQRYVVSEHYNDVDSIRRVADEYLADMNKQLQRLPDHDLVADLYEKHKDKYARRFQRIEDSDSNSEKKPLEITVTTFGGIKKPVDPGDICIVHKANKFNEGDYFIVFNDDNKIVSFVGFQVGIFLGMIQF